MKKLLALLLLGVILLLLVSGVGLWIAGGGDGAWEHEAHVEIARPPAELFPFLVEPELIATWMDGLVTSEPLTEGGVRLGARSRDTFHVNGRTTVMETEITALEEGRLLRVHAVSDAFTSDVTYTLSPGRDGTRVAMLCQSQFEGFFFKLIEPIIGAGAEAKIREDLAALKQVVEARSAGEPEGDESGT